MKDDFPYKSLFSDKSKYDIEDTLLLDLLDICGTVYKSDISIKRNKDSIINITIPVNNFAIWESAKNKLNQLVNFITADADVWNISFSELKNRKKMPRYTLFSVKDIFKVKKVALYSGGLDSFAGICNDLNYSPTNLLLSGFKINNHEVHSQNTLFENFIKKVDSSVIMELFAMSNLKKIEYTQRTRSLLFLSIAITLAKVYELGSVYLYENGIMSLNPELNHSRYTTKTTHPITIRLLNEIITDINLGVRILHPYLYSTKSEMVSLIPIDYVGYISSTITCGMNRQNPKFDTSKKHCGACVPCLLRKISLSYNDLEDYDVDYDIGYDYKMDVKHSLSDEYKSSLMYYIDYRNSIKDNTIYDILSLRERNYYDDNWFERTEAMLNRFADEVDRFLDKHKILKKI